MNEPQDESFIKMTEQMDGSYLKTQLAIQKTQKMIAETIKGRVGGDSIQVEDVTQQNVSDTLTDLIEEEFNLETIHDWAKSLVAEAIKQIVWEHNSAAIMENGYLLTEEEVADKEELISALIVQNIPVFFYHGYILGKSRSGTQNFRKVNQKDVLNFLEAFVSFNESTCPNADPKQSISINSAFVFDALKDLMTTETQDMFLQKFVHDDMLVESIEGKAMLALGVAMGAVLTKAAFNVRS